MTNAGLIGSRARQRAEAVIDQLIDVGPQTAAELGGALGLTRAQVASSIAYAREHVLPCLGMAVPAPVPEEGWTYQVTTEWEPVERGATRSLQLIEARMSGVLRDVSTILPLLPKGSRDWRRANFLNKHLTHITATLKEINE